MDSLLEDAIRRTAAFLIQAGAKEVYLFGSVAKGTQRPDSDVDFAVSGIAPQIYFRVVGQAEDVLGKPMDVIDLDEDTEFCRYLRRKGEMIRVA